SDAHDFVVSLSPPASVLALLVMFYLSFFYTHTTSPDIYPLSLHDALPISGQARPSSSAAARLDARPRATGCYSRPAGSGSTALADRSPGYALSKSLTASAPCVTAAPARRAAASSAASATSSRVAPTRLAARLWTSRQ